MLRPCLRYISFIALGDGGRAPRAHSHLLRSCLACPALARLLFPPSLPPSLLRPLFSPSSHPSLCVALRPFHFFSFDPAPRNRLRVGCQCSELEGAHMRANTHVHQAGDWKRYRAILRSRAAKWRAGSRLSGNLVCVCMHACDETPLRCVWAT